MARAANGIRFSIGTIEQAPVATHYAADLGAEVTARGARCRRTPDAESSRLRSATPRAAAANFYFEAKHSHKKSIALFF